MNSIISISFALLILMMQACTKKKVSPTDAYKGKAKHAAIDASVLPHAGLYDFNQGVSLELQQKLNNKIASLMEEHSIAGISVAMLVPDRGFWHLDTGYVSKPNDRKVDEASVFYWASVAKLVTSTVIYQLIEEQQLNEEAKLSEWFPDLENANSISIKHLLTHTNGLYSFNSDSTFHASNDYYSPEQLLAIAKANKNLFPAGQYWAYTNTGYLLLALIAEKIENKTFQQIVADRVTTPLQLKSCKVLTAQEEPVNLAQAHKDGEVLAHDYSIPLGAGNIVSNSTDMLHFLHAVLTSSLLQETTLETMLNALYPMFDNGMYYGRGIMVYDFNEINKTDKTWIGHSGGTDDYKALLVYDTTSKAMIAISINQNIPVEAFANSLFALLVENE